MVDVETSVACVFSVLVVVVAAATVVVARDGRRWSEVDVEDATLSLIPVETAKDVAVTFCPPTTIDGAARTSAMIELEQTRTRAKKTNTLLAHRSLWKGGHP